MMYLKRKREQEKVHFKNQGMSTNYLLLMKTMVEKMMKMMDCHLLENQMPAQHLHIRKTEQVTLGIGIKRPLWIKIKLIRWQSQLQQMVLIQTKLVILDPKVIYNNLSLLELTDLRVLLDSL